LSRLLRRAPPLAALAVLCCTVIPAPAALISLSTGQDAAGNRSTSSGRFDANWSAGGAGPAVVTSPEKAEHYGDWLANGPGSDWIVRNTNVQAKSPTPYAFSTTFDLTGFDLTTVSLAGSWALNHAGTLYLNDRPIASLGSGVSGALTPFSVAAGSALFNQGLNTLRITMTTPERSPEAARLDGALTGTRTIQGSVTPTANPEPATAVILGTGVLTLAGYGWRRRKAG
jgi:hypothetical protein